MTVYCIFMYAKLKKHYHPICQHKILFDRRLTLNSDMQKQNVGEYHEIISYVYALLDLLRCLYSVCL